MPKPMYVWTGTAWVSVASEVESLATYATQSYADNQPGMKLVVPTSVAVGSGSGSVATQGTVTFSGASSVSLNGCFSSTYQNYKIIISNLTGSTTSQIVSGRLRASGTDASGSNYNYEDTQFSSTTVGAARSTSQTSMRIGMAETTNKNYMMLDLYDPFIAEPTGYFSNCSETGYSTTSTGLKFTSGGHTVSTSYDGFTIFPASGTITGTLRIYGYKVG